MTDEQTETTQDKLPPPILSDPERQREVLEFLSRERRERVALDALIEWRKAEKVAEEANYAWTESPTPEADRNLEAAFRVKSEKLLALRAAADELIRE